MNTKVKLSDGTEAEVESITPDDRPIVRYRKPNGEFNTVVIDKNATAGPSDENAVEAIKKLRDAGELNGH